MDQTDQTTIVQWYDVSIRRRSGEWLLPGEDGDEMLAVLSSIRLAGRVPPLYEAVPQDRDAIDWSDWID